MTTHNNHHHIDISIKNKIKYNKEYNNNESSIKQRRGAAARIKQTTNKKEIIIIRNCKLNKKITLYIL